MPARSARLLGDSDRRRDRERAALDRRVLAAFVWGTFVSVKAPRRLKGFSWFAVQALLFGAAIAALASLDHPVLGALFALAVAVNLAVLYAFYSTPS